MVLDHPATHSYQQKCASENKTKTTSSFSTQKITHTMMVLEYLCIRPQNQNHNMQSPWPDEVFTTP